MARYEVRDVLPIEAGLDFTIRKKGEFIGADALAQRRKNGARRHVISLRLDDEFAVPLGHEPIFLDEKIIGQTSSCAFAYREGKLVVLGHIEGIVEEGSRV